MSSGRAGDAGQDYKPGRTGSEANFCVIGCLVPVNDHRPRQVPRAVVGSSSDRKRVTRLELVTFSLGNMAPSPQTVPCSSGTGFSVVRVAVVDATTSTACPRPETPGQVRSARCGRSLQARGGTRRPIGHPEWLSWTMRSTGGQGRRGRGGTCGCRRGAAEAAAKFAEVRPPPPPVSGLVPSSVVVCQLALCG